MAFSVADVFAVDTCKRVVCYVTVLGAIFVFGRRRRARNVDGRAGAKLSWAAAAF